MNNKLKQMNRVKVVRQTRERISEVAAVLAGAKLHEAEQRLVLAREAEKMGARAALRALEAGEKGGLPAALRKQLGLDCEWYEKDRHTCEEAMRLAQAILHARRVESEQAVVLHREIRTELAQIEDRRSQADLVDRFLARSRWRTEFRLKELREAA